MNKKRDIKQPKLRPSEVIKTRDGDGHMEYNMGVGFICWFYGGLMHMGGGCMLGNTLLAWLAGQNKNGGRLIKFINWNLEGSLDACKGITFHGVFSICWDFLRFYSFLLVATSNLERQLWIIFECFNFSPLIFVCFINFVP